MSINHNSRRLPNVRMVSQSDIVDNCFAACLNNNNNRIIINEHHNGASTGNYEVGALLQHILFDWSIERPLIDVGPGALLDFADKFIPIPLCILVTFLITKKMSPY